MCRTVWMWLLILAVLSLFCESEGWILPCCKTSRNAIIPNIKECYEQNPRADCNFHAFVVMNQDNKKYCVKPDAPWLKRLITKGLKCPAITPPNPRFAVLNKVDMDEALEATLPCCTRSSDAIVHNIKDYYEQKPKTDCRFHAFVVINQDDKKYCVDPDAPWLKRRINEGMCPPIIT